MAQTKKEELIVKTNQTLEFISAHYRIDHFPFCIQLQSYAIVDKRLWFF